jgi:hypothetical protein
LSPARRRTSLWSNETSASTKVSLLAGKPDVGENTVIGGPLFFSLLVPEALLRSRQKEEEEEGDEEEEEEDDEEEDDEDDEEEDEEDAPALFALVSKAILILPIGDTSGAAGNCEREGRWKKIKKKRKEKCDKTNLLRPALHIECYRGERVILLDFV